MKTKTLGLAFAMLGAAASALAQRVTWSVTIGREPVVVVKPAWNFCALPYPPPPPLVTRPWPPVLPPPPVCDYERYFRRSGVYVYARGPRRVYYPNGYRDSAVLQEWCPVQRTWITIGRAPPGWF